MQQSGAVADEIDLRELVAKLWHGRLTIVLSTVACTTIALAYALLATEIFRSQAIVQPREDSKGGAGLASVVTQFGGLADLTGLSLGGGGDRAVAVATLKSRVVIEQFILDNGLLQKLYESKWDEEAGRWKQDDPAKVPTSWEAYNDFTRTVLRVSEDKKTGLVTVSIDWTHPQEAQQWATELVARTNLHLKTQAIREGEANLAYLNEQSKRMGQVELRQAAYGLVESELKKLMVAKGSDEFALKTIDPATVPKKRERPRRALIVLLGIAAGGLIGALVVLVRRDPTTND